MVEKRTSHGYISGAAGVIEEHFEEIVTEYERRLLDMDSPLVAEASTREQLKVQARSVLEDVASNLRGQEEPSRIQGRDSPLSTSIGTARASEGVHASESLRAVVALSEAALSVVVDNLPPSSSSKSAVAEVALAIQKSIMERVAQASLSYVGHLLARLHESHADERRRIGRELHDRVAHSIMVVFRNLELCEIYEEKDLAKAQEKFEFAKRAAQEALESTRNLSSELRNSSAEEGLEVALSDYLRLIAPLDIEAKISARGDESLIPPEVRGEVFLVLREAVRNAVAHSGAENIRVELSTTRVRLRGVVKDDGRGFKPEEEAAKASGTGLASMKERALLLGGALSLRPAPDGGTRVEISVPLPSRLA